LEKNLRGEGMRVGRAEGGTIEERKVLGRKMKGTRCEGWNNQGKEEPTRV
jgi:hypothetical protein